MAEPGNLPQTHGITVEPIFLWGEGGEGEIMFYFLESELSLVTFG